MKTTISKIAFLCIVFTLLSFQTLAESMNQEIEGFVNDLQIKPKSVVVIGEITHLHTGKKWELSQKIKNILVHALGKRFSVMDRSLEKSLKQEREKSISGYSIITTEYLLTGTYEIKKEVVQIELKLLSVDTSELVASKVIVVNRSSIEIYLRDYSEAELDLIIDKQNREIRSLLKKQEEKRKKAIKYQQIKQRKDIIARLKRGKKIPYKDYSYKLLWIAGAGVFYGATAFSAANKAENDGKKGADSLRAIGTLSYIGAAWGLYYYLDNKYASLQVSPSKISISIVKKF